MTIVDEIAELIHRRRRQILVHSILYYNFNENLIDDFTYDSWARELAELQRNNPEISDLVQYHGEAFEGYSDADFSGSVTGFHLPLNDPRANALAEQLLAYRDKHPKGKSVYYGMKGLSQKELSKGWLKRHLTQEIYNG